MELLAVDQRSVRGRGQFSSGTGYLSAYGVLVPCGERLETCGNARAKEKSVILDLPDLPERAYH